MGLRLALFALPLVAEQSVAQASVDSSLAAYIAGVRAVDNHAHPMRAIAAGAPADTEFDALPLDALPPFNVPWRLRMENPEWLAGRRALYDITSDSGSSFRDAVNAARSRVKTAQGARFPEWVLDQVGTEVMLANRIALGPSLAPPRFRWVPFADALMLPLDSRVVAARTPDTRSLYKKEAALLQRYLRDLGMRAIPRDLDSYVRLVVVPTLQRQRNAGAVAEKFEAAYLRALDFDDPDSAQARRIYAKYAAGGSPGVGEYKTLEDYLFRVIARESGRLGMAVHIHATDIAGGFYLSRGSAPHLLEPAFNDSTLRGTNFVIVHGGWPLAGQTMSMLNKPNVYADISMMVLVLEPSQLAGALRQWLAEWPEKVLYGSDAFDGGPDQGWEEVAWMGATTARRALAIALTGMMRDGEITRSRAEALARMVLRDNAARLYGLNLQ